MRQTVAERVVERVDEALKADIMHWAAFYVRFSIPNILTHNLNYFQEVRMRIGSKKIYHLEAWVVKVMSLYKVCPCLPCPSGLLTMVLPALLLQHRYVRF